MSKELSLNTIHLMDCLEGMSMLPSKSADMILSDLPYGITSRNKWDVIIPFEPMWKEFNRVIKDDGAIVLTAAKPFSAMLIMSNPKMFRYDLIWRKNKVSGHLNANRMPLRQHEEILVFYKKLPTYNPQKTTGHRPVNSYTHNVLSSNYGIAKRGISGGGQTDRHPTSVLDINVLNNDDPERFHPTQKPVELFEWLIKSYSNVGELILDPCIGSGTTAVAAENLNRNWLGFDNVEEFVLQANERIARHRKMGAQ